MRNLNFDWGKVTKIPLGDEIFEAFTTNYVRKSQNKERFYILRTIAKFEKILDSIANENEERYTLL